MNCTTVGSLKGPDGGLFGLYRSRISFCTLAGGAVFGRDLDVLELNDVAFDRVEDVPENEVVFDRAVEGLLSLPTTPFSSESFITDQVPGQCRGISGYSNRKYGFELNSARRFLLAVSYIFLSRDQITHFLANDVVGLVIERS